MLTLTDAAGEKLSEILSHENCPADVAVRLVRQDQGLAMTLDREQDGDTSFEHAGKKVLLLDEQVSDLLENETLDVETREAGDSLMLRHDSPDQ